MLFIQQYNVLFPSIICKSFVAYFGMESFNRMVNLKK